ncbi:MAG: SMP-30/gluconolactonase/LRE family protein [Proteobacteria bacterium]|nr:MAG: SMP-30/gluconolactonase/LRE family protein [Pseudomonadota bacterium]
MLTSRSFAKNKLFLALALALKHDILTVGTGQDTRGQTMNPQIEIVADVKTRLGESPVWSSEEQRLYWVDILRKRIYRSTEFGAEVRCWVTPSEVGCLGLRKSGGAVLGLQTGFHFIDFQSGELAYISNPLSDFPENRFNDGKVDRQGRFVAGSMRQGSSPKGSAKLFLLDHKLKVQELAKGFDVVNGPCWNRRGDLIYFTDSEQSTVFTADYDQQRTEIGKVKTVYNAEHSGVPDGATIDEEGFYWQARAFAGEIIRLSPEGRIVSSFKMPINNITSLCFGGANMDRLFATSMGTKNSDDQKLDSSITRGSIFSVSGLGIRGIPESLFLG